MRTTQQIWEKYHAEELARSRDPNDWEAKKARRFLDREYDIETAYLKKLEELKAEKDFHEREAIRKQADLAHTAASPAPVVADSPPGGVEADKAGPLVKAPAQGNSTKTRRKDSIDPVIELAQAKCRDPKDTNQVWPQMQVLADNEQAPFLASTAKGLKYHKNGKDAYFTRDALNKRLHPEKRRPAAARH